MSSGAGTTRRCTPPPPMLVHFTCCSCCYSAAISAPCTSVVCWTLARSSCRRPDASAVASSSACKEAEPGQGSCTEDRCHPCVPLDEDEATLYGCTQCAPPQNHWLRCARHGRRSCGRHQSTSDLSWLGDQGHLNPPMLLHVLGSFVHSTTHWLFLGQWKMQGRCAGEHGGEQRRREARQQAMGSLALLPRTHLQ